MTSTIQYRVAGMTCGHCETAVRAEVSGVPGVTAVEVSAQRGLLIVTTERSALAALDSAVLAAVDEAGYDAVRS